MNRTFFAALLLVVLSALPGQAQIQENAWTLSPMIGGHLFDGDQDLETSTVLGLGLGYNLTRNWAIEGVFTQTEADADLPGTADADVTTYRLDGLYHFQPDRQLVPYLAAGVGGISTDPQHGEERDHLLLDYGVGIKYFVLDHLIALRADIRHLMDFPEPDHNLQYTAGLTFQFGKAQPAPEPRPEPAPVPEPVDSDHDGVNDDRDQCPETPSGVPVDAQGCPRDSDGDGIHDGLDRCPATPEGTPVDSLGCPRDSDDDGVYDVRDRCPGTPQGAPVNADGCPRDSDHDGVADYLDRCPATPGDAPVDKHGCPRDSDGDGVYDYLDQCPDTPRGVSVDNLGCPTTLTLHINFGHDSSRVGAEYDDEIAKAAQCIRDYPGNTVFIDGHTDSSGAADYNQSLSEQRAAAVKQRLMERFGIPEQRMIPRGFGESRPVANNDIPEGRALNRRVEVACGAEE